MRTIDFVVALVMRLTLLAFGVGVIGNGAMILHADLMLSRVIGPNFLAAMTPMIAIHVGITVGGIALTAFAVRGLIKTVRQKLSQPRYIRRAGSVAAPLTAGRILAAITFGAGAVFGLATFVPGLVPLAQGSRLSQFGVTVAARVDRFTSTSDPDFSVVYYSFSTPDGKKHTGHGKLGSDAIDKAKESKRISVVYLPDDPAVQSFRIPDGTLDSILSLLTRAGLILVGIWGVWKNLRREDEDDGAEMDEPDPIAPPPLGPVLRAAAMSAPIAHTPMRRTFGRRGI